MGCCSGRSQNEGNLEYSKTNKDKILEELSSKASMKTRFTEGWRLHHQYEAGKSFLSFAIEKESLDVLATEHFTVSEAALLEKVNERPNYEFIFSNLAYVDQLAKNYESEGFVISNEAVINCFLEQEKTLLSDSDKKRPFALLRDAFGVDKPALTDEKKEVAKTGETTEAAKEGTAKVEEPKAEEAKKEEVAEAKVEA